MVRDSDLRMKINEFNLRLKLFNDLAKLNSQSRHLNGFEGTPVGSLVTWQRSGTRLRSNGGTIINLVSNYLKSNCYFLLAYLNLQCILQNLYFFAENQTFF